MISSFLISSIALLIALVVAFSAATIFEAIDRMRNSGFIYLVMVVSLLVVIVRNM